MKIITLSEGSFTIDQTKIFVPFYTEKDDLQLRPRGSLLVEIQPFLVETSRDLILLDAGLGFSVDGTPQILRNIADAGYAPHDVSKVLLSHLHRDHAGGLTYKDTISGKRELSFPNAIHYIHHKELSFALEPGNKSYEQNYIEILENNDKVILVSDEGLIDGYIRHQLSGGHSPFHQVFWIAENDEIVFFGGDEAPQLQQMKTKFTAKYDYDGKKAMELRQLWWEKGKTEQWKFLFYHDIKTPQAKSSI
jgi:glyoxylase-like metal-dependent hydrolase (beta-lactamase superfamily II)